MFQNLKFVCFGLLCVSFFHFVFPKAKREEFQSGFRSFIKNGMATYINQTERDWTK